MVIKYICYYCAAEFTRIEIRRNITHRFASISNSVRSMGMAVAGSRLTNNARLLIFLPFINNSVVIVVEVGTPNRRRVIRIIFIRVQYKTRFATSRQVTAIERAHTRPRGATRTRTAELPNTLDHAEKTVTAVVFPLIESVPPRLLSP